MCPRLAWLAVALLAACDAPPDTPSESDPANHASLVVFAPAALEAELVPVFAGYTAAAGVAVAAHYVAAPGDILAAGLDRPPADLLIVAGADAAARAADEGTLRPVAAATGTVPPSLRDPDGAWLAIRWRPAVIAYDVRALPATELASYEGLAAPGFTGRLCLSTFEEPVNRAVIASLVNELGAGPAERVVRGWLANLARPVYATEAELLEAIAGGQCAAGIVLRPAGHDPARTGTLRFWMPPAPAGELAAAGVARHAAQPEQALALLDWLVTDARLSGAARETDAEELPGSDAAVTAWFYEDAQKLAERAGYR